jgi:hypothetical protein
MKRRGARLYSADNGSVTVTLRLSREQHKHLSSLADQLGMPIGAVARNLILKQMDPIRVKPPRVRATGGVSAAEEGQP